MKLAVAYLAAQAFFAVIDTLWLRIVARGFYRAELGDLLAPQVRLGPATGVGASGRARSGGVFDRWPGVLLFVLFRAEVAKR
jgi:hypothetical protein